MRSPQPLANSVVFIVSQGGIEINPTKIKAITEMSTLRTEKEVQGFLGRINYIGRLIAKLTTTCAPLFKLLLKKERMIWNNDW